MKNSVLIPMHLTETLEKNIHELRDKLDSILLDPLEKVLSNCRIASEQIPMQITDSAGSTDILNLLNQLSSIIIPTVDASLDNQYSSQIEETLKSYNSRLEQILSQEKKIIKKVQDRERFRTLTGDPFHIKIGKAIKSLKFRMNRTIYRFIHRDKSHGDYHLYQSIPHWQLLRYIYRNRLQENLLPLIKYILESSCGLHAEMRLIFKQYESIYLDYLVSREINPAGPSDPVHDIPRQIKLSATEIKALKAKIQTEVDQIVGKLNNEYEQLMSICGTLEFPSSRLWPRRINSYYAGLLSEIRKSLKGWGRNHWLLFEDWRFDQKLNSLIQVLFESVNQVQVVYEEKIKKAVSEFFTEQGRLGEDFTSMLEKELENLRILADNYKLFKYKSSNILIRKITQLQKAQLSVEINNISLNLVKSVNEYGGTMTFARSFQAKRLVRNRDIVEVNPMQIILADMTPALKNRLSGLTTEILEQLEKMINLMIQYTGIIDFGIGSVLHKWKIPDEGNQDMNQTILDSFSRASGKNTEAEEIMDRIKALIFTDIHKAVEIEAEKLLKLKDTESIFLLQIKLTRAKTLQSLNNFNRNLARTLKSAGSSLVNSPVLLFNTIRALLQKMSQKIGYAGRPVSISTELSDFLSKTDSVFNNLPYIYQRLYLLEPLEDELFFIERQEIFNQINLALENWTNNGYSPLVLVGEKGSGATTLFSVFQKRADKYPFLRISNSKQIFDEASFIRHMAGELGAESIGSFMDLKEYLLGLPDRSVAILEDLQRYYLRVVNGFSVLKRIFELISSTNQNILWLCSCTTYSWNYFERVVSISSYFGFVVKLDDIKDDRILKVIEQRHRISGFQIRYVPNKLQEKNKKILRMPEQELQEFLSQSYRSNLARFAKGNISLALVHWIRSTREIQEKTVVICSIYESDYSFLESLPSDCILTLYMILLHDGLQENQLSMILNRNHEEMRIILIRLFDDGILVRNNDIFYINSLVYRQLVNFLRIKNFLH